MGSGYGNPGQLDAAGRPKGRVRAVALSTAALAAALFAGVSGHASADPSITSKQTQAQAVLAEIQLSNSHAEQAANRLYAANQQLDRTKADLQVNRAHLSIARRSLIVAQKQAAARLRSLYMSGDGGGLVAVLLGSQSFDEMLNEVDAQQRVSRLDVTVVREVKVFHREVKSRQASLVQANRTETTLVAERLAAKQSIETELAREQRLLSSIRDEIATLRAAEQRRQALLAQQARQRDIAQQQQLREQAAFAAATLSAAPIGALSLSPGLSPPPARYGNVVAIALQYLGVPYVWGGESPATGFDCSGLVAFVYAQVGVILPHNAAAQYAYGVPVSRDQLEPGDLVFFDNLGHVGLYIGGGNFEQAPQTGDVVKITSLNDPWVSSHYYGAKRIL